MRVIPFGRIFEDHEQDANLLEKLQAEAPGILNWLLSGLAQWQELGLGQPPAVREAVKQYRQQADTIGSFLAECCRTGPELRVGPGELNAAYRAWAQERGVNAANGTVFKTRMVELRFKRTEIDGKNWWHGLALVEEVTP